MFSFIHQIILILLSLNYSLQDTTFKIIHTGDIHASYESRKCGPLDCGGIGRVMTYVKQEREYWKENLIYLDAGDVFTGSYQFYAIGYPIAAKFTNLLNPNASCLGNHEFDLGIKDLISYLKETKKVLCCNCDCTDEPKLKPFIIPSKILKVGENTKVGIVGYIAQNSRGSDDKFGKVKFTSEKEAIKKEVENLTQKKIKIIILLGHAGYTIDQELARDIPDVDVIVGGHSHTFLSTPPTGFTPVSGDYPTNVTNHKNVIVPVVHAYQNALYVGNLTVTFDQNGILTGFNGAVVNLGEKYKEHDDAKTLMGQYSKQFEKFRKQAVGKTIVTLQGHLNYCRRYECNMGNLITDAYIYNKSASYSGKYWTDTSIAFLNSGVIRSGIDVEHITMADLVTVLPFSNVPVVLNITGSTLLEVLNHSISWGNTSHGEFLQFSGLRVVYDCAQEGSERVYNVRVRCAKCITPRYEQLNENSFYNVITTDFLAGGGDGYIMLLDAFAKANLETVTDVEIIKAYIETHQPIAPKIEDRIIIINDHRPKSKVDKYRITRSLYFFLIFFFTKII